MKRIHAISLASVLALAVGACTPLQNNGGQTSSSASSAAISSVPNEEAMIEVNNVTPGMKVTSPMTITGRARGPWYFEASFPAKIVDGNGTILDQKPATAQSDWMTEDFVPFSVTLTFATPVTATGMIVLENDNPSGMPENAKSISIPVQF